MAPCMWIGRCPKKIIDGDKINSGWKENQGLPSINNVFSKIFVNRFG